MYQDDEYSSDEDDIDHTIYTRISHTIPLPIWAFASPYTDLRRAKLILFGSVLSEYDEFKSKPDIAKVELLRALELRCKNFTIDVAESLNVAAVWGEELFTEIYTSICSRASSHLENDGLVGKTNLAQLIFNDMKENIDPSSHQSALYCLPTTTSLEMFPSRYRSTIAARDTSRAAKVQIKTTTMHTCGRCGDNHSTVLKVIIRSADEGCSYRITCVNCDHSYVQ